MKNDMPQTGTKKPSQKSYYMALLFFGFSLFYASSILLFTDNSTRGIPVYTTAYLKFFTYLAFAFAFRHNALSGKHLCILVFTLTSLSIVAYLLSEAFNSVLSSEFYISVRIIVYSFIGISEAVVLLAFLQACSEYHPDKSIPALASMFLVSHVLLLALRGFFPKILPEVSIVCKIAGVCVLLLYLYKLTMKTPASLSETTEEDGYLKKEHKLKEEKQVQNLEQFNFIIVASIVFPFVFGFFQTIVFRYNASRLFDLTMSLMAIGALIVFLLFLLYRKERQNPPDMFSIVTPFYLLGCISMPLFWEESGHFIGSIFFKLGYSVFQVLLWGSLLIYAHKKPKSSFFIFGIPLALSINAHGGITAIFLLDTFGYGESLVLISALAASVLFAAMGYMFFVSQRKSVGLGKDKQALKTYSSLAGLNEKALSNASVLPAVKRELEFRQRFSSFLDAYNFSEREVEILIELTHGYSLEEIGNKLGYSRGSIKQYVAKIYSRTGVTGKQELIREIETFKSGPTP